MSEGIVVRKDGSSAVENEDGIGVNAEKVERIIQQHLLLREHGFHTAEINSGAVSEGKRAVIEMDRDPEAYTYKTLAMIGMPNHFSTWQVGGKKHGLLVPSSLATDIELRHSKEGKEIKGGMGEAIKHNELLLVGNYHDEADSKEMKIYQKLAALRQIIRGNVLKTEDEENDGYSYIFARAAGAKILLLCTTVDGFYEDGKKRDTINVKEIGRLLKKCGPGTKSGKGGMRTKLLAAKNAAKAGITVVIGHTEEDSISLIEGNAGTLVVQ